MSDRLRDEIRIYIKGKEYNPMYKFSSFEELLDRIKSNCDVPPVDSFVTEARRDDNIIALNESWKDVLDKLIIIFGYEDK